MSRLHRLAQVVVFALLLAALAGVAALWPWGSWAGNAWLDEGGTLPETTADPAQTTEIVDATLIEVEEQVLEEGLGLLPGAVEVDVVARLDGSGDEVAFSTTDETGGLYEVGQRVELARITDEGAAPTYYISDFQRDGALVALSALFIVVVLAFGRLQGLRALVGLGLSGLVIVGFIVPAILAGFPPVLVAIVGAVIVMIVTLWFSHGLGPKTTAAILGTAGALVVTAGLAQAFVDLADLTGFTSEEARLAAFEVGGLSLDGLLLAGIIIGGLGVLDDVTISQSSTVFELRAARHNAHFRAVFAGALNVGRDHIAATINTLFLAYAGAALPLLILFTLSDQSLGTTITSEIVAVEIVRTLVGSIGLIAAVPLTTALATSLAIAERRSGPAVGDAVPPDGAADAGASRPTDAAADGDDGMRTPEDSEDDARPARPRRGRRRREREEEEDWLRRLREVQ